MIYLITVFILLFQSAVCAETEKTFKLLNVPPYGEVLQFALDKGGIIYVSSRNGYYKSTDSGDSWTNIFNEGYSESIFIDRENKVTIINEGFDCCSPGFYPVGYYSSTDKGLSWSYIKEDHDSLGILTIDTANNIYYKLYLYKNTPLYKFFIYKSTDFGNTWLLVNNEFEGKNDFDPDFFFHIRDSIFFLSYYIREDYKNVYYFSFSEDNCKTWSKPVRSPERIGVLSIHDESMIFLNIGNTLNYSTDKGITWQNTNLPAQAKYIYEHKSGIYIITNVGLFFTKDISFNWIKISEEFLEKLLILPTGKFVGSNGNQILVSDDSGKTWRQSTKGFTAAWIFNFSINKNGDFYCPVNGIDCYHSLDEMKAWEKIDFEGKIIGISFDPEGNVYASESFGGYSNLYKSTDNGKNWQKVNKDFTFPGIQSRVVFARNGNIVCNSSTYLYCISKDGGNTWEKKSSELATIHLCMNSEGHLFGTAGRSSLTRSTDNGETWSIIRDVDYDILSWYTHKIIFHPWDSTGYMLGEEYLGKTTDNGRTWTFPKKYKDVFFCTGTADSSGNIYIIDFDNLYVQLNGEDTFRIIKHNYKREYFDMQTAPDGTVYATTEFGGLYRLRLDLIDGLSVEEIEPSPLFAFPNPARDYIEIPGIDPWVNPGVDGQIHVYNAIGECVPANVAVETHSRASLRIDVSGLPAGVYFVRCGGTCTKFVKGE